MESSATHDYSLLPPTAVEMASEGMLLRAPIAVEPGANIRAALAPMLVSAGRLRSAPVRHHAVPKSISRNEAAIGRKSSYPGKSFYRGGQVPHPQVS